MTFPVFIPSKSRADTALTPTALERMGVPFRIIVEDTQHDAYATQWGEDRLLVLPTSYQDDYDTFDELARTKSLGPGPARNFAWQTAIEEGHDWHWVMDDNLQTFYRLNRNVKIECADATPIRAMEEFVQRYSNVGMAGPQYESFAPVKARVPPFITGTRIYSCNLIRNSLPWRWRGRYNEDTDLSLNILKGGWATIQFYAFLQKKIATQRIPGGNTEAFYAKEGTVPKSAMLARMHPDVVTTITRWKRAHHHVDYSQWQGQKLIRDPQWTPTPIQDRIVLPEGHETPPNLAPLIES